MCQTSDPALASISLPPCCPGLVCRQDPEQPEVPGGDKFCMLTQPIPEHGNCEVSSST